MLAILPPEQMADLLARALEERGFERCGDQLSREQDGVVLVVDASTGSVSVHSEDERTVAVEGELEGFAADQAGAGARQARQILQKELHKKLDRETDGHEATLQTEVTDPALRQLSVRYARNSIRSSTASQPKHRASKAAQLGQIKELTEDPAGPAA